MDSEDAGSTSPGLISGESGGSAGSKSEAGAKVIPRPHSVATDVDTGESNLVDTDLIIPIGKSKHTVNPKDISNN